MDYSRIQLALKIAQDAMDVKGMDIRGRKIAEKIIDAAINPEEKLDIRPIVLGVFMALFAMMDAAAAITGNTGENEIQKTMKKNKDDDKIVH